ncbi:MAG: phosphatidylinositol-specific phospholipase C/glycerophosphodiester phosphodiesterase family protein [Planctomycetes bacterium]|nr:phosphatidylinositol-specific phospholipase C/glycerophosphodiester phosphodiesterase family protein [Planctomycetota bacterium]
MVRTAYLTALAGCVQPAGHAHNDYLHPRPLLDALAAGFASVEADVFLVDGELRVGHERDELVPGTLESLYLEPLRRRVRAGGGSFALLVDIKAEGAAVYAALRPVLARYREILTSFRDDGVEERAVRVILSGDRPIAMVRAERERLCAIDGRPEDLESDPSPFLVPWISESWSKLFGRGTVELDAAQRARLQRLVDLAHGQGRLVRLWGAPDTESTWAVQRDAGVDRINTDRLAAFARWSR